MPGLASCCLDFGSLVTRAESKVRARWTDLPKLPGVYLVYLPKGKDVRFSDSCGAAIHGSPSPVSVLDKKWEGINHQTSTDILYVGKADCLRKRIREFARFGAGKAKNHAGGEWLWQVQAVRSTGIRIICCPPGKEVPFEKWVLDSFRAEHRDWPLANRKGGDGSEIWYPVIANGTGGG